MTTIRELITGASRLINIVQANEAMTAGDMSVCQEAFSGLLDSLQADLLNIYTINPYRFVLVPGQQEYTLGPMVNNAGQPTNVDWPLDRPVRVERAVLLQGADVAYAVEPVPPPVLGSVILQAGTNLQYLAEYETWSSDEADPFAATWDEAALPTDAPSFDGTTMTWPETPTGSSVRVSSMFPADPANGVIEFKVLEPTAEGGYFLGVGIWVQGFGPPWDPNSGEGAVTVQWVSDGRLIDYGGTTSGYPTFEAGDVIGLYADLYTNTLSFFKNGVYQFQAGSLSATIWPRVGLVGSPS